MGPLRLAADGDCHLPPSGYRLGRRLRRSLMWLKILTLLSLFCLWPIVGLAQLPKDPLAQETLRGLPGVRLIVEKINAEVERDGLTTDFVRTTAETRLRAAGIRLLSKDEVAMTQGLPTIQILVQTARSDSLYAYCIEVSVWQEMVPIHRQTSLPVWVRSWVTENVVGIKSHKNIHVLKTTVEDLVDAFIHAYVAVNPK
jgi:hypothetical protein